MPYTMMSDEMLAELLLMLTTETPEGEPTPKALLRQISHVRFEIIERTFEFEDSVTRTIEALPRTHGVREFA